MAKWRVTVTYQSKRTNNLGERVNEPVTKTWLREGSEISAVATIAQLLESDVSTDLSVPEFIRTEVLSILTERVSS